jgi:glutathione peroxidase-family protein
MLKYVRPGRGFEPKATMFERVDVNGKDTHPLFEVGLKTCPLKVNPDHEITLSMSRIFKRKIPAVFVVLSLM